jgi:hypothetical protein
MKGWAVKYAYPHFKREMLLEGLYFGGGPAPDLPMPKFDLPTSDGDRLRKSDFVGRRPLLLTFASITCPMVASNGPALKRLHKEFGDRVAFVTLYVREAHPGERYPQPEAFEQKLEYARAYKGRDQIPWPVAVDNAEGDLHRALDPKPDAAYLMDTDRNVAFRTVSSSNERVLQEGLEAIASQQPLTVVERQPRVVPLLKGMGMTYEVLDFAGQEAKEDFRRELAPIYLLVRFAALFRPLPPFGRGIAAIATSMFGLAAVLAGLGRLLEHRSRPGR